MMNTHRFAFFALAATLGGLSAPSHAQTPASNPSGSYQPLSPTAAKITLPNGKTVRGNVIGQSVTKCGTYYVVETRKGQTIVDQWALLGVPSVPVYRDRHSDPLPNIHLLH
jgi:hypothetical protein